MAVAAMDAPRLPGDVAGDPHQVLGEQPGRHFWFHKTQSLDYAIVLEGEIYAMMDVGETLMRAPDIEAACREIGYDCVEIPVMADWPGDSAAWRSAKPSASVSITPTTSPLRFSMRMCSM
jgi:hypothetical protein